MRTTRVQAIGEVHHRSLVGVWLVFVISQVLFFAFSLVIFPNNDLGFLHTFRWPIAVLGLMLAVDSFRWRRKILFSKKLDRATAVNRADVTVRAVRVPNSFIMATNFSFDGVTPFADAYKPRACDAPDWLDAALGNAPQGSIVRGGVYWDAYRDPVSVVVLLDRKSGEHLAQWNL